MKNIVMMLAAVFFVFPCHAQEKEPARLSMDEIDSKLEDMRSSLPADFASGITWADIKRNKNTINYTYIVEANSADWDEEERQTTVAGLQDFGCRQLMPAMCEGSKPMFDAGLVVVTTYHDSFGNYLFDCSFALEACKNLFARSEEWLVE